MPTGEQLGRIKGQIEETVEELEDLAEQLDDLDDDEDEQDDDSDDSDEDDSGDDEGDDDSDEDADDEDEDEDEDEDDEEPSTGGPHPSDVLPAMRTWTLTRPTGAEGDPDNDYLVGETLPGLCFVRDAGVVFVCPAGGVTTENSDYPRDELRQMADDDWAKAEWSSSDPHSLEIVLSLDASELEERPRIVGAQIHDGGDDVIQLMLHETDGLGIMHMDGKAWESLDPDYEHGQRVTVRFEVVPRPDEDTDLIEVWYEGRLAAQLEKRGDSWYFKAGVYVQSSPEKWGERPDAVGVVVIYKLEATGTLTA